MHHYIDIHLRTDPELPAHQLMDALYAKFHRVLVKIGTSTIGVSFPGYQLTPLSLGSTMRLIGPPAELARLMGNDWLSGLRDYTTVSGSSPVPAETQHRTMRRIQAKSNPERLMRRQMRRHGLSEEQARKQYEGMTPESLRLPFVTLASASTGQAFRLFLQLDEPVAQGQAGEFNAYGLSASATLPWF